MRGDGTELNSRETGLTKTEVSDRLKTFGLNKLPEGKTDSLISIGINLVFGQYTIVENNTIQNLRNNSQLPYSPGIVSVNGTGDKLRNNVVQNVYVTDGDYGAIGIFLNVTTCCTGIINFVYNNMFMIFGVPHPKRVLK